MTGDLTQIDLPWNVKSGLRQSIEILQGIEGIGHVKLTTEDVVRHRLVKEIIKAYDFDDERRKAMKEAEKNGKNIEAIIAETSAETPVNGSESDVKEVL